MSPLQQFMQNLLQNHSGEVLLMVDNALPTTKRLCATIGSTTSVLAILSNSSNHSCSRWETQEPSPTRTIKKVTKGSSGGVGEIVAASTKPIQQRRSYSTVQYKNSSPACPIRKLSPRVHPDMCEIVCNIISPHTTSQFPAESLKKQQQASSSSRSYYEERRVVVNRPPLSPRKNKVPMCKTDRLFTSSAPGRVLIKPAPPSFELQNDKEDSEEDDDEEKFGSEVPTTGLIRGLSQTLGTDMKEQAPICPTRRPSTQSNEDDSAAPGPERLSQLEVQEEPQFVQSQPQSHACSVSMQNERVGRDILVFPHTPGQTGSSFVMANEHDDTTRRTQRQLPTMMPLITSSPSFDDHQHCKDLSQGDMLWGSGGCNPILLQHLNKRR